MSPTNTITQTTASTNTLSGSISHTNIELKSTVPVALRDQGRVLGNEESKSIDLIESLPQPSTAVSVVERWNHPKANIYRTFAILFAFTIMGANDAAYGVSNPVLPIHVGC